MSIFNLHSTVVEDYRDFVRSSFNANDDCTECLVLEAWQRLGDGRQEMTSVNLLKLAGLTARSSSGRDLVGEYFRAVAESQKEGS